MKIAGLVSEFNPFHSGHEYLLGSIRERLSPDAVVCVMSGNFVQRGEPALLDKWARAKSAVLCGADLVLELPFCYAVNGASEFAKGAIRILKGIGATHIAFGSESGDAERLAAVAEALTEESEDFKAELAALMSGGMSYPAAYCRAASGLLGSEFAPGANDTLAIEYLKQNVIQNAGLKVFCVLRKGAAHDDMSDGETLSAARIRRDVSQGMGLETVSANMPERAYEILSSAQIFGAEAKRRYFELVRYLLLNKSTEELAALRGAFGGIEGRLHEAALLAEDTDELIKTAKSKNHTYSGIARFLACALVGVSAEDYAAIDSQALAYARLLAFNEKGAALAGSLKKTSDIPVITNVNKNPEEGHPSQLLLDYDIKAAELYNQLLGRNLYRNSDRVRMPVRVEAR